MIESDNLKPMRLSPTNPPDEALQDFDPIEREAYEWVARYMGGEMTPADIEAIKQWYGQSPAHAAAYAKARRVWMGLGPAASAVMRQNGEAGETVSGFRTFRGGPRVVGRRTFLGGAVAAAAAASGYVAVRPPWGLWPSVAEVTADYRTATGEQRQVTFGSALALDLNTRTSIAIRARTASETRIALVSGETAVSAGAASPPLTVTAGAGRVTATRAKFDLRYEDAVVQVTCIEGAIDVECNGASQRLAARQQVGYGADGMSAVTSIDPDAVTAWQRGLLIFDGAPVAQVISEVNRYRPGRIVLMNPDIGQHLLSARLRIAEADKIVDQIVHIFGAKATNLPGGIVILT
ncbi:sigma factor regulator VreR [Aliidongia dinghuensis]|uniref:Sigma factor regulator VreR n=2 Tax=Aliidongia dinghuensis TaxID=1867774 RepID=A0A8J3E4Z9_9PROT|nr:sigma factor regulator VreR [Aliidongia dinghuensis]